MSEAKQDTDLMCSIWGAVIEDVAGKGRQATPEMIAWLRILRGRRLPPKLATEVRATFGRDVADVRLHTGPQADTMLGLINARACCLGRHILLGGPALVGESDAAGVLLHELTHICLDPRHDTLRCWDAREHAALSAAACTTATLKPLLAAIVEAVGMSWPSFLQGIRHASSNMDFRGRVVRYKATLDYLGGVKGEGTAHGESTNYTSTSMADNRALNIREEDKHIETAVRQLVTARPLLKVGKHRVGLPTLRSPALGATIGGVSVLERKWVKSLGNALHVAQDRASHREGTKGHGHDDPRCPAWKPDKKDPHEHSMGKGWERCGAAAHNKAFNNSADVLHKFLQKINGRKPDEFKAPLHPPGKKPTHCP